MIEIPSAVLIAAEIAAEVDFLCLGTNDLVQYLLAVDRDNESVADWFRTLHPAVIRAMKMVVKAAEDSDKPLIVCGEMAGSPFYAPVLIGLGVTEMSMNVNSIPQVRKVICGIAYEETLEIIKKIENAARLMRSTRSFTATPAKNGSTFSRRIFSCTRNSKSLLYSC